MRFSDCTSAQESGGNGSYVIHALVLVKLLICFLYNLEKCFQCTYVVYEEAYHFLMHWEIAHLVNQSCHILTGCGTGKLCRQSKCMQCWKMQFPSVEECLTHQRCKFDFFFIVPCCVRCICIDLYHLAWIVFYFCLHGLFGIFQLTNCSVVVYSCAPYNVCDKVWCFCFSVFFSLSF